MAETIKVPIPERGKNNLESKFMEIQKLKADPKKYQEALQNLLKRVCKGGSHD